MGGILFAGFLLGLVFGNNFSRVWSAPMDARGRQGPAAPPMAQAELTPGWQAGTLGGMMDREEAPSASAPKRKLAKRGAEGRRGHRGLGGKATRRCLR